MRGATIGQTAFSNVSHISIHAPHAGRDIDNYCKNPYKLISIHAPHAGRDLLPVVRGRRV